MSYIPYGFVQKPTGIFIEPQQAKVVQQIYQRYLAGLENATMIRVPNLTDEQKKVLLDFVRLFIEKNQ